MNTRDDRSEKPRVDLLDVLATGEPPAFATTQHHRITFWNSGAARVLGRQPEEVLGAHCHEVLRGRDLFGNLFCYENCPLVATARRGDPVSQCEFTVAAHDERKTLAVTTLHVPGSRPEAFTLIHVLQPITSGDRLLKIIEESQARSPVGAEAGRPADGVARANGNGSGVGHGNGNGNGNGSGNGSAHAAEAEPPLTTREREILRQVASGLQNKEIAQALGISLATVRNHVHNILDKLGVHSKLEAVCLAFRSGWVDTGDSGREGAASGA